MDVFVVTRSFFSVFGKQIPIYGLFFYLGIAAAIGIAVVLRQKRNISFVDFVCSSVFCFVGAIIGSKLLFLLVTLKQIIEYNIPLVAVIKGGFVFYGGLLGGMCGLVIYTQKYTLPFSDYADLIAAVLPIGHAFGRIGCFFGGCCYGIRYEGMFSVVYKSSADRNTPINTPLFPVQLVGAIGLAVLGLFLIVLYIRNPHRKGMIAPVYLASYGLGRFLIEFLRGDAERGLFLSLATSQWISILFFALGILMLFLQKRKKHI